jgi:hypothetical protein
MLLFILSFVLLTGAEMVEYTQEYTKQPWEYRYFYVHLTKHRINQDGTHGFTIIIQEDLENVGGAMNSVIMNIQRGP